MTRLERAVAATHSVRDVKVDAVRLVVTALLTLAVLGLTDWPDGALGVWLVLVTAIGGLAVVMFAELAANIWRAPGLIAQDELERVRPELEDLRARQRDADELRAILEKQTAVFNEQLSRKERALKITEATKGVLWGVVREQNDGVTVPTAAILNRIEAATRIITQEFPPSE